jgi:hypothetical protein
MKKIVFLIAIFMLIKPAIPVLDYIVNYGYITKALCINKEKPKLKCNGKCYLMKELAKASESEKPISSNKKTTSQEQEILFLEDIKAFKITSITSIASKLTNCNYSNIYLYLNSNSVFRPPIFIS